MSKKAYRSDKTCLNCRHVVAEKFCPNCGQENTDTRKTFHHLFLHFIEDLTHYENAFWRTIKNLIFKPAALTKEYLSGKRLSYLAPVRLYIFISFLTFFFFSIFPSEVIKTSKSETKNEKENVKKTKKIGNEYANFSYDEGDSLDNLEDNEDIKESISENDSIEIAEKIEEEKQEAKLQKQVLKIEELRKSGLITEIEADTIKSTLKSIKIKDNREILDFGYRDLKELDSLQKFGPKKDRLNKFSYWFNKKLLIVKQNNTHEEIIEKAKKSAFNNFPKVLIIYMPFFAFFLWIFHGKKRWYYFDHGIFTLHYFSFLLLITFIMALIIKTLEYFFKDYFIAELIAKIIAVVGFLWSFYYFFPAHHRFYGETRWISFFKSIILFYINMFFIVLLLALFFLYTIINIH